MLHNQRKNRFLVGNDVPTYIIFGPEHKKYGIKSQHGSNFGSSSYFTLHLCLRITRILGIICKTLYWIKRQILVSFTWQSNSYCNRICICISIYTYLCNCVCIVCECLHERERETECLEYLREIHGKLLKIITSRGFDT